MAKHFVEKATELQLRVQDLLNQLAADHPGAGFQAAAYWDGRQILNASSGTFDATNGRPVASDTLFTAQSCSKGITSTAIHILVEQGKLDYDARIADYWPEFGQSGKESITLRQVLTHTAGVPLMPDYSNMRMIADWPAMVREMEKLVPIWEPGSKSGYHGLTFGWILGETAFRADGRPFPQIVQDEICKPLGLENDLYIGAPPAAECRIAKISGEAPPIAALPDEMLFKRVLPPALVPVANPEWNEPWFHQAAIPAVNAVTTSSALARMYASLIGEVVDGVRLLKPETVEFATSLHWEGIDEVGQMPSRLGLGYALGQEGDDMGGDPRCFGYSGLGGVIGYADPSNKLAVAVLGNQIKNELSPDHLVSKIVRETLGLKG